MSRIYTLFVYILLTVQAQADPTLSRYLTKFRVAADKWAPLASLSGSLLPANLLKRVTFELGRVPGATQHQVGACVLGGTNPKVTIDGASWDRYGEWEREALVFHELGHCILHREHDNRQVIISGRSVPKSLMNEQILNETTYLLHRDYYHQELFQNVLSTPNLEGTDLHD